MLPAARQGDLHSCPLHGPSDIDSPCCPKVYIENRAAARVGDSATCPDSATSPPGPDLILHGSPTVKMGNLPAARMTEQCTHGGIVVTGAATVFIGNPAIGPDGMAIQTPPMCAFLKVFADTQLGAKGGTLHRLRDAYTMSAPITVIAQPQAKVAPALYNVRTVVIRGHVVQVYEPVQGVPPNLWLPSSDNIAKGLATLSDEQLRNVKAVYIVPQDLVGNPAAIADCGDGVIRYFPRSEPHSQADIDWALQHEAGHAFSMDEIWAKDPSGRKDWIFAIGADHRTVSAYGNTDEFEDFAEFIVLYSIVKGTPCEASARALFPNRWKIMDKLFPNGLPARNPRYTSNKY